MNSKVSTWEGHDPLTVPREVAAAGIDEAMEEFAAVNSGLRSEMMLPRSDEVLCGSLRSRFRSPEAPRTSPLTGEEAAEIDDTEMSE